jgi:hypothetical protein
LISEQYENDRKIVKIDFMEIEINEEEIESIDGTTD